MTLTLTLQRIEERQTELAAMIAAFKSQAAQAVVLCLPEMEITLHPGEHYAGAVLDEDGQVNHHLVLMAERPDGDLDWNEAKDWAETLGGSLPDRQEQALLYANCKPHLKPVWHWSSETHENDASYAWLCGFDYGGQTCDRKSASGAAVAVRRLTP